MNRAICSAKSLCLFLAFSTSLLIGSQEEAAQADKVVAVLKRNYPHIDAKSVTLKNITDTHLQKVFAQARFYQVKLYISMPPKQIAVAELGQEIVQLPREFNHLVVMAGIKLTNDNVLDVAYAFCQLADPDAVPYMQLNRATAKTQQINTAVTTVQLSTYSRLGGIVKNWEFTFNWGQLSKAIETVSQKDQGNYIRPPEEYKSYHRSPGIPKIHLPLLYQPASKPEQGLLVPAVNVDKSYVTIRENGSATSQAERTVNITVSGFDANTEVTIKATSFGGTDGDFLNVKATTDGNGAKTYAWVANGDASQASDLANVSATGKSGNVVITVNLPASAEGPFALQDKFYNPDQFNVDPDLALTIYYCTGYENYIGSTADAFKNSVRAAMVASYVKQVTEWRFMRPVDQDQDYHVYINDGTNDFHDSNSTAARAGTERMMWVQADIYSIFPSYSSAQALINVAVAHEFFHGLQYGYHRNLRAMWSPDDGDWIIEGQARFIQTVQYESEEFANTQNLYPRNANLFLQQNLNSSLKQNTYNYCIYWRFLYENYRSSNTEADRMAILARALTEADKQEANGQDAVVGGELAMNDALSGGGGIYNSFDASIDNFAKANYFLKLDNADPSQKYKHQTTYIDPAIAAQIVYSGTTEEITGDIPASYGMDFIEVSFTAPSNGATFSFDGGTGDKFATNDNDDFHVTLLTIDNNRLVSERNLPLDGTSEEGQLELTGIGNDPNDKVVVVVTRLDNKENDANAAGNYKLKVTPSVDIALVLDRSGSMAGQKLIDAKNSARTFVGFMQTGDKVGVVSFATSASVNFPLTTIVAEATKTAAQNAINGISATGSTAIGAGMQLGQSELNKGDPNHPHAMLLMSDGQENMPPYVVDVLPAIPQETDIYTIGLGSDADGQLLSNVAGVTGGEYNFAPNSAKLQEIYQRIQSKITKQQTLTSYSGTISQGNTLTHPVTLDALISRAIFSLTFQGSDVDLELVTPSGKTIDPQVAAADPNIDYTEGATFDFYTVLSPEPGSWTLRIQGVDVPTPESYFATVQVSSLLKMDVTLDKNEYNAGEPILISAKLIENAQAITGASVSAEVTVPTTSMYLYQQARASFKHAEDAETNNLNNDFESNNSLSPTEALQFVAETITLFDDGNHNDGAANDGVYANYFRNTTKDGSYTFTVQASGTASQAGAFMRETAFSTFVKPSTNPFVISVQPDQGKTGQTLNVVITGANYANGAMVSFSGTGITVNSISFISATQLNANISIAANASLGLRDVIVQNPNGQNGMGSGLFNIIQSSTICTTTFTDDFNDGNANGWRPKTPSLWHVNPINGNNAYCLDVLDLAGSEYTVMETCSWDNFELTLRGRSTAADNRNFFILFGAPDPDDATFNGYYLQFAIGGVRLFRTIDGAGVVIASHPQDFASDNNFHQITVRREGANLKAFGDGLLLIDLNDTVFPSGVIGFGSFKATACFDDVNIVTPDTCVGGDTFSDDFNDGNASGWTPLTPSRWQVRNDAGSLRYYLNTSDYNSPDEKRLGELSIINSQTWGDFTFECDAKSEDAGIGNSGADLSIVFGYQDFDSYYYVNYNRESGFTEMHRIHDGGPRVTLATYNAPTFNDGNYHKLRIEREGSVMRAYFDGILILSGNDSFFGEGRIGVGSFNDAGYFDNIVITGCKIDGLPNLLGTALSFSQTTYKPGDAITFTGTVMNNGSNPTRPDFRINVFLTDSPTEPDYNLLVHSFTMPALDAGNSNSFTQIGTIPPTTPADTYYLWMNIDVDDQNPESNEDDNSFRTSTQLTVTRPGPLGEIKPIVSNPQTSCAEYFVDIRVENVTNLFGVSFVLNYTNTAYVNYIISENGVFLGNDVLLYANPEDPLGKVSIGVTRKTGQPGSTGSGVIVRVKFSSPASTPVGTPVTFSITDIVGIDPLNNSISLTPQSVNTVLNCGITVWPGDTNNDGIVNQADVLPLGLHWNRTGPARSGGSCAWSAQLAAPWTPLAATYANANGDGIVNQADVLCIGLNWNRTHTTVSSAPLTLADDTLAKAAFAEVFAEAIPAQLTPGQEFILKIQAAEARNLFGLAFELQNDRPELLQILSVEPEALFGHEALLYSHLGESGNSGIGITHKNGQPGAQGAGAVIRLRGKISSAARLGEVITLTLNDIVAQNHEGHVGALPSSSLQLVVGAGANVALQRSSRTVTEYQLYQNYPNPFNPETMIAYDILEAGRVTLRIFNTVGQEVRTLIDETQSPGAYQVRWDGRNTLGQVLPSGIYFYRLQAGEFVQIRKMTLVQ